MKESKYVRVPVVRGYFEILPLVSLTKQFGGYIMGGYVRFMASKRKKVIPAMDVDIFTNTEEVLSQYKAHFAGKGMEIKHENEVSITYAVPENGEYSRCPIIQVIKPMVKGAIVTTGTIEEILNNFDFTITRIALAPDAPLDAPEAIACETFLDDEKKGLLKLLNIHCPISSLLRTLKYGRKGFHMRPAESLKLFADWMERDDEYRLRIMNAFQKGEMGQLTKEEIDELEALLRID